MLHFEVEPKKYRVLRTGRETATHGPVKILMKNGKVLSEPQITPFNESLKVAERLRREASRSELAVAGLLAELGFDHSVPMCGFYLDFFHPILKVCVEIDGPHHEAPERRAKDKRRDAALRAHGIRTWRFNARFAQYSPKSLRTYILKLLRRMVPDLEDYLPRRP